MAEIACCWTQATSALTMLSLPRILVTDRRNFVQKQKDTAVSSQIGEDHMASVMA
jgi:hypothetical protein